MKKVMVFGTFDILHDGHKDFFSQAKQHGDFLIVVVAQDETVLKVKGNLPLLNAKERLRIVGSAQYVDMAVLGNLTDYLAVIREHAPDIICLGYDQHFFVEKLSQSLSLLPKNPIVTRLQPFHPEVFKSSLIKLAQVV